jgi:hypothetical protein
VNERKTHIKPAKGLPIEQPILALIKPTQPS